MNKKWTLGDIIDLEYLLEQDKRCGEEDLLQERDRELYLSHAASRPSAPADTEEPPGESRGALVRLWLSLMRKQNGVFPGKLCDEGFRLLRTAFFLGGIGMGLVLSLSLFSYTGRLPLNISYFLGLALVPQTLLLVITLGYLISFAARPGKGSGFGFYPLLSLLVERAMKGLHQRAMNRLSAEKQGALASALGVMRRSRKTYGLLFFWPLFILMQLFGVGFNLGVIGTTLGRVAFFDTAFGWQSTLALGHGVVFKTASIVALPWSWLFPEGIGYPSLAQVEGTRLILKDGIYNLATQDLVSWWPFLCLSVVFYGLLPRLALFITGAVARDRALKGLNFDRWELKKLVNRLVTPIVSTEPLTPQAEVPESREPAEPRETPAEELPDRFLALVHDDIHDDACHGDGFKTIVRQSMNCYVGDIMRIGLDFNREIEAMGAVLDPSGPEPEAPVSGVLLLQEAWLPPIREILDFIARIRRVSRTMPLVVVLIGKPGPDTIFTATDPRDREIWNMKINSLGDPLVHVETLVKQ
ncbi:MAG: DUF2868 domain-containing protein [Desulfobacteraceae bacterium]|nr:DUF2868 domain-containing protein [Desulfobacteraceae bacterium]